MVWINTVCANVTPPPGHFGGARCVCEKCNPYLCPICNEPITENERRVAAFVEGIPKTVHQKCSKEQPDKLISQTCRHGGLERKCDICFLEKELSGLQHWVTRLLDELPVNRDWLDPVIENELKERSKS